MRSYLSTNICAVDELTRDLVHIHEFKKKYLTLGRPTVYWNAI